MQSDWPKNIKISFVDSNGEVENLLVSLHLLTEKKNNYTIDQYLTNKNGEIVVARSQMKLVISEAKREYPMDYAASLGECNGLKIRVEDEVEFMKRLEYSKEFYPAEAMESEKKLKSCVNDKYVGCETIYTHPISEHILYRVTEKK